MVPPLFWIPNSFCSLNTYASSSIPITEKTSTRTTAKDVNNNNTAPLPSSPRSPRSPRVHFTSHTENEAIVEVKRTIPREIRKGYSSGASSISDETDDKNKPKGHKRDTSDILRLESMKTSLLTDGTLSTNVVRMETPFGKSIETVYNGVRDGEILGSGISGVVRLVTHKDTGCKYAVKILDLGLIKNDEVLEQLRDEIYIMLQLDHPNIVRLEEVYESTNEIYIVQELCLGGDLFDRLDMQPEYHYTEVQCAQLVKQMLSSVRYLHSRSIIHRDLKLENFLFSSPDPVSSVREDETAPLAILAAFSIVLFSLFC